MVLIKDIISMTQSAQAWLDRGAVLFPCQPGQKAFMRGYGPYRKQITTPGQAYAYFRPGQSYNLAVGLPGDVWCIDFDQDALYSLWADQLPDLASNTLTETSRRGMHVFLDLPGMPAKLPALNPGAELKKVIMVAPSKLEGRFQYRPVFDCAIARLGQGWKIALSLLLSDQGQPDQAPAADQHPGPASQGQAPAAGQGADLISRIKAAVPVLDYARRLTELRPSDQGQGQWYVGRCPFHDDQHPSFMVRADTGFWACRAGCGRGDVINLHAKAKGLTLYDAIKDLARELPTG